MNRGTLGFSTLVLLVIVAGLLQFESIQAGKPSGWELLRRDNGTAKSYYGNVSSGHVVGVVLRGADTQYPLRIQSVETPLYRFSGAEASARIRAVIYSLGGDGHPLDLIASSQPTTVSVFYPTPVNLTLDQPVLFKEPQAFLAGIEFLEGNTGTTPSFLMDSSTNIPLRTSFYSKNGGGAWIEHYDMWNAAATTGYPMIRAWVETGAATPTGSPTATRTPTLTPTATPTFEKVPNELWPGRPIGYGKQHTMVRSPDGRLHLIYADVAMTSLYYAWSADEGQTWQPEMEKRVPFLTLKDPGVTGSLALDPDGHSLHLIIGQDVNTSPPTGGINGLLYLQWRDGRWSSQERIADNGYGYNLAVGPDGRVHVVWSFADVWYRVRATDGTWSPAKVIAAGAWHPDIDIDHDGGLHVAYNGNSLCCDATWVEVYYIYSADGGGHWAPSVRLTNDAVWSGAASGAVDAQGRYHLTYLVRSAAEGDLYYRRRSRTGEWTAPEKVFLSGVTGQTGAEAAALEADAAGNLVALYMCMVPGWPATVCLQARDDYQGRWQDSRRLSLYAGYRMSLAGGTLDTKRIPVIWEQEKRTIYRLIDDVVIPPTPTPTPTATPTPLAHHVRVVDETGQARQDARVYRNGVLAGITRPDGVLNFPDGLAQGDELIALAPLPLSASAASGQTTRSGHGQDMDTGAATEPWAFRVFLTNMRQSPDTGPMPPGLLPDSLPGERRLVVRHDSALVLLNLTVSIEWDANQVYLDDLSSGLREASAYLYDVTDGQMAIGQVSIYDRSEHWDDADIRIAANNLVIPYAAVAGVSTSRPDYDVRLGPLWNGQSARYDSKGNGAWSRSPGYRTIVHELGHYVLGLFDEYVHFEQKQDGSLSEKDAFCTHPVGTGVTPPPPAEPSRASIMYDQQSSSELSDRFLPALWSEACAKTEQWDRTGGESDWDTLLRRFRALNGPTTLSCEPETAVNADYCLWRPSSRGHVLPSSPPPTQRGWPWPVIVQAATADGPPERHLNIDWNGEPRSLRVVAKHVEDGQPVYTEQGLTHPVGNDIVMFGVPAGAELLLNTLDRSIQTSLAITTAQEIRISFPSQTAAGTGAAEIHAASTLRLRPQADGQAIQVEVGGAGTTVLWAEYSVGGETPRRQKLTVQGDVQVAVLPVDLRFRASGTLAIVDDSGQLSGSQLQASFVGRGLPALATADVLSGDGRLWFHLDEGVLHENTYILISSYGATPFALPHAWQPSGLAYAIAYPAGFAAPTGHLRMRPNDEMVEASPVHSTLFGAPNKGPEWMPLAATQTRADSRLAAEFVDGFVTTGVKEFVDVFLPLVWQSAP